MSRDLEAILEPAIDEHGIAVAWQRLQAKPAPRRRLVPGALALAAAIVAAVIAWPAPSSQRGPLAAHGAPVVALASGQTLAFDDGSTVVLGPTAQLEVLSNEADRFVTLLRTGRTRFDVHPGGPRRWQIESSRATVEVVGTAFVVDADEHRLIVEVERGVVVVRGERVPGRVVRLTAGERLEIDDPTPPPPPPPPPAPAPVAPIAVAQPVIEHPASDRGAGPASITPPIPRAAMSDVLALADVRRGHGDAAGAADAIARALPAAHADEAGLAHFTLGRLYLDDLGQPDRAAAEFAAVIALGTPSSLVEHAYARRAIALARGGHRDDAVRAAADYDRAYPHGVHRRELHAVIDPP